MDVTIGPDGSVSLSPDYEFLAGSVLRLAGLKTGAERFREIRKLIGSNRADFSIAARDYFRTKGFKSLGESALLVDKASIFPKLLKLQPGDQFLSFEDVMDATSFNGVKLPDKSGDFIENVVKYQYSDDWALSPFYREGEDLVYRLTEFNYDLEAPDFKFKKCRYRDYINTCEYHAHSVVDNFVSVSNWRANRKIDQQSVKRGVVPNPFNFFDLNCSVGINTLLVLADEDDPSFVFHDRSKANVAEAQGLKHVVPAGTFQPIHREDTYHEQDFSLYANILREFAEELLGDSDITHPVGHRENIYKRESIRPLHHLISIGRGAVYLAGFGIDALTAKPEFLTIMVLVKKDLDRLFSDNFIKFANANKEGAVIQDMFTIEKLEKWRDDPMMLAAGSGCFHQAVTHFSQLSRHGMD